MSSCSWGWGAVWLFHADADEKHKTWRHQYRPYRAKHVVPLQGTTCVDVIEFLTLQSAGH